MTKFSNTEMCRLTEQVVFTEPYTTCAHNRWTSPQLDKAAEGGVGGAWGVRGGLHDLRTQPLRWVRGGAGEVCVWGGGRPPRVHNPKRGSFSHLTPHTPHPTPHTHTSHITHHISDLALILGLSLPPQLPQAWP